MQDNRPSTSADPCDSGEISRFTADGTTQCPCCAASDVQISPTTSSRSRRRSNLPPDRTIGSTRIMLSTFIFVMFALSNAIGVTGLYSSSVTRVSVREFDDNGIGTVRFFPMQNEKNVILQRMVHDKNTNRLIVGAVNHLYDVHTSLAEVKEKVFIGDEGCEGLSCAVYVKALAIDKSEHALIECSGNGTCKRRSLGNISHVIEESIRNMVPYGSEGMATALVTETCGVNDRCGSNRTRTLFLGTTPVKKEDMQYIISGYNLKEGRHLEALKTNFEGLQLTVNYENSDVLNLIDYIFAFEHGNFVYFIVRQNYDSSRTTTHIARFCKDDTKFHSYSEIPMICNGPNGEKLLYAQDAFFGKPDYDLAELFKAQSVDSVDLVFTVFSSKFNTSSNVEDYVSGVCVYDIREISRQFEVAQKQCHEGHGFRGFNFQSTDVQPCTHTKLPDVQCGSETNPFVDGSDHPVTANAWLVRNKEHFSSIYVHGFKGANVAFIGTAEGVLHKAVLLNETSSKIFKTVQLTNDGSPILQDKVQVDLGSNIKTPTLFVMSKYAVHKLKVDHCDHADNCIDCVRHENPFCGWCVKLNRCAKRDECSFDFINYRRTQECPSIINITPNQQDIVKSRHIMISTQNIPVDPRLKCVFKIDNRPEEQRIAEHVSNGTFKCVTPTFPNLAAVGIDDEGASSVTARLSIVDGDATLISSNFTFFDCQQHSTCNECSESTFPCFWCIKNNKCVTNAEDACREDVLVVSRVHGNGASRIGPSGCPRIDTRNHSSFYIGLGKNRQISVKAENLDDPSMQHFKCNFSHNGQVIKTSKAIRRGSDIECLDVKFDSFEHLRHMVNNAATLPIDLNILWAQTEKPLRAVAGQELSHYRPLGNPHNIQVIVYTCERLADNCGHCLILPKHYECGWCDSSSKCTFRAACASDWMSILSPNSHCKAPKIINFWPRKGPRNGGTRLNITGVNLGLNAADVEVFVENNRCQLIANEYKPTESIVCMTGRVDAPMDGHVIVRIGPHKEKNFTNVALDYYRYADPEITYFSPVSGPVGGGTDIVFTGKNLDSGRDVTIRIGIVNCRVLRRTEKELVCRTEAADSNNMEGRSASVSLTVDGAVFSLRNSISYTFLKNPAVTRVDKAVSIVSGGILTDVVGRDLKLLQRPKMVVKFEDKLYYGERCIVESTSRMQCRTPTIVEPRDGYKFSSENPIELDFGFSLDQEEDNFNKYIDEDDESKSKLNVYPDPKIINISNVQSAQVGSDLVMKGENLILAAAVRDVNVTVGGAPCVVTALASVTLTCQLGPQMEEIFDDQDDVDVIVSIGNKIENVGRISGGFNFASPSYLILGIVFAFFLLVFILIIICYRRLNKTHNKEMLTMKHQMTTIEMKIAQECKEAFHELQTNLNAIAGSLPEGTPFIPFLSYQDYTARILFPQSFNNHPVLRELDVDSDRQCQVHNGLKQLHNLLLNKTFLLAFVRTIDDNKYMLQKDRVYVGSLLMVVFQDRMDYCTEILKQLLKELIKRNLEARFQPKILFRRAESVAERMLSVWFSFLMYGYLTGTAGQQLYQFYWATKQQTEKGPQDSITLEARYSLSEEKLLRATVHSRELTVFVVTEGGGAIGDTQVTVLDCDSITQVKEKCIDAKYRTIPFSGRPLVTDVDLELRLPGGQRKMMLDLDQSSRHDNGYWRYNTLAHYNVENKAMLALVPRQANSSSYNLSLMSDRSDSSSKTFHNSPTLTRPFGTTSSGHSKDTMRVYHLVRQHGEQEPQEKMMSEIYLNRLLYMKGTLQKFIENLFEVIFATTSKTACLPACVKYMFDFLDDQAREHGIVDEDVSHAWKSNALPLRFWVNLIKNPDFIFDIPKPTKIEGSLNVVAQTLMDACSKQDQHLTKDSPSSKLLFANDIEKHKNLVARYYNEIAELQRIPEENMSSFLLQGTQPNQRSFHACLSALNELYIFVAQNRDMIYEELTNNEYALHGGLPEQFRKMLETMDVVPDSSINNGSLDNYNSKSRLMSNSHSRFF
uniref:Sema domain-containing protein n=1 Tax=Panagrellus redivivus TaxID=6233 RepID=A0A7E4UM35_PANRE